MEYEVRFYYGENGIKDIISRLDSIGELEQYPETYEKTIQYNHSDNRYNFYSNEIDGRFRYRVSSNNNGSKTKLSWKRRLNDTTNTDVNKEEEVEVNIDYNDIDNFLYIVENVLHMNVVESYERYRTVYKNSEVEISIDKYPFGYALEIESTNSDERAEQIVSNWCKKIGLDIKKSYRLSWDDKYEELCKEQNVVKYNEVTFDKDMPKIVD